MSNKKISFWKHVVGLWGIDILIFILVMYGLILGVSIYDYHISGDPMEIIIASIIITVAFVICFIDYYIRVLRK